MTNNICGACGENLNDGVAFCKSCGAKVETAISIPGSNQTPIAPPIVGEKGGVQYKTIAGPIELKLTRGENETADQSLMDGYETAVKQYAKIIDKEAVGGWKLHLIQQIAVKKLVYLSVIIVGALGAILGAIFFPGIVNACCCERGAYGVGGFFLGALLGAGFGCLGLKYTHLSTSHTSCYY